MKRFPIILSLLMIAGIAASQVPDTLSPMYAITRYHLAATINSEDHTIEASATISIKILRDSIPSVQFRMPAQFELNAVLDSSGEKLDIEPAGQPDAGKDFTILLRGVVHYPDSFLLTILYQGLMDTTGSLPVYIDSQEFSLPVNDSSYWFPRFSGDDHFSIPVEAELRIRIAPSFKLVNGTSIDTLNVIDNQREWVSHHTSINPYLCFTLFGSPRFITLNHTTPDSLFRISFWYDPKQFDSTLAIMVIQSAGSAADYFSTKIQKKPNISHLQMIMLGVEGRQHPWYDGPGIVLRRNSTRFSVPDTLLLRRSSRNPWLYRVAQNYSIMSADSERWLREGWTSYLTTKYLLSHGDQDIERDERLALLMNILDFYHATPISEIRNVPQQLQEQVLAKETYFFLMLDYLLGQESMEVLIRKITREYQAVPVTVSQLQTLAEEEYGSSLEWFFKQWVYGSGIPELVLTTDFSQTNRGNYSLRAKITQRTGVFMTPVDLLIIGENRSITKRIFVQNQEQTFEFILPIKPIRVELDPQYLILRWVPRLRLLAHARTAERFLSLDKDLNNAEREAQLLLQLDPLNATGWNSVALFTLGSIAVLRSDLLLAEEYFRKSSTLSFVEPAQTYPLMSMVRLGNVLEMQDKREQALQLYQLVISAAEQNPAVQSRPLDEARHFLRTPFISYEDLWLMR